MVAAIGEQIRTSRCQTGSPQQRLQVLATHTAGAVSVDGYTLTLAVNPWNIVRTYNLTPGRELPFGRYRLGTASNFVVYMSEADNVYDPLYGSFVGDQGAWSTAKMYFTVPPNGVAKLHFVAHFQAGPAQPDGWNGGRLRPPDPGRNPGDRNAVEAEEGTAASALLLKHEFLDGGADDVTLATLGEVLLTAQGNVGCDQLLCNDVNCTDVFTTRVDASGAVSCAALTATGTVAGATLTSTGAVSGSSLSISGAASVGLLSSATGITGSTLTINNTANAGNFTTVGDVSTGTLTASGAATAASFAATGALTGATLTITGAASAGPLDCESLDCTFTATSGGVSTGSVVCGDVTSLGTVSAPQLFASNTLIVTNTSDFSDDLFL